MLKIHHKDNLSFWKNKGEYLKNRNCMNPHTDELNTKVSQVFEIEEKKFESPLLSKTQSSPDQSTVKDPNTSNFDKSGFLYLKLLN